MHEVLVNRLGGLSLPRKSVVRLTDRPDMTFDVYRGRKQQCSSMVWDQESLVRAEHNTHYLFIQLRSSGSICTRVDH